VLSSKPGSVPGHSECGYTTSSGDSVDHAAPVAGAVGSSRGIDSEDKGTDKKARIYRPQYRIRLQSGVAVGVLENSPTDNDVIRTLAARLGRTNRHSDCHCEQVCYGH
jgi:hypothetical protein